MLDLQIDTPEGAARILSDGQIVLLQQKSALIDSITRTLYNKDPLADLNFEQYSIYDIVDKYNARNEKVYYEARTIVQPLGSSFSTTIEMNVDVPLSQEVRYRPGVLETLKFAWAQYVMVLVPVLWATNAALSFLFKYRVLDALLVSDLKPKRKIM